MHVPLSIVKRFYCLFEKSEEELCQHQNGGIV